MRELEIVGWAALSEFCQDLAIGNWIFRGVENGEHQLVPAIGRPGGRRSLQGVDLGYDAAAAAEMLQQFKLRARPLVSLPYDADDLEWWALGRHHGLPTPVLDWTTSFLTAAYFACHARGVVDGSQRRAAIYAVECPPVVQRAAEAYAAHDPVAYFPPHLSPRITAQNGLLTFHSRPDEPWRPAEMLKVWIPSKAAIEIKVVLAKAGINESSMVPGLDGIAGYCGWLYKREFFRHVSLPVSGGGAAWDKGYNARGERQFHVQLTRTPSTNEEPPTDKNED